MTDEEVKDFVAITFTEYFKSIKEEKILRKVAKSFFFFLKTLDKVEKYIDIMQSNSPDSCIHPYNVGILNNFDSEYN